MNNMLPFKIKVAVCKTDRIVSDPIESHDEVFAYMEDMSNLKLDQSCREVLILPCGKHLIPGLKRGGLYVVSKRDMTPKEEK